MPKATRSAAAIAMMKRLECRMVIHAYASKKSFYPRDELANAERLCQVVVGTELQSQDLVDLCGLRGEHKNRHRRMLRSNAFAELQSAASRHYDIEDDEPIRVSKGH